MKKGEFYKRRILFMISSFCILSFIFLFYISLIFATVLSPPWTGTLNFTQQQGNNITLNWSDPPANTIYSSSGTYTQIVDLSGEVVFRNFSWSGSNLGAGGINLFNVTMNGFMNETDSGRDIVVDSSGNIYIVGTIYMDSVPDIYLGKFDSTGKNLWNHTINGVQGGNDRGLGVDLDSSGNITIVGEIKQTSNNTDDIYIGKFDSTGKNLWNVTINGQDLQDQVADIKIDSSENIYVLGYGYITGLTYDIYLGKFNSTGGGLWNLTINGGGNDYGYGLDLDPFENIYISGQIGNDIYLGKFNSTGGGLWNHTINGLASQSDIAFSVKTDSLGNAYVTGIIQHVFLNIDLYLGKFNSSGTNLWNYTLNGPADNFDYGYKVSLDPSEDIFVTGYIHSTVSNIDLYLGKFNSSGTNLWNYTIDGPPSKQDIGYGIAMTNSSLGTIYLTGEINSSSADGVLEDDANIYFGKFRDANPLKFQVCSCNDALCSGEILVGPDNTSSSYFISFPILSDKSFFMSSSQRLNSTLTPNNRYFQYKAYLSNITFSPNLSKVEVFACVESWICTAWSPCTGTQTRTCTDENNCGTTSSKPATSQTCNSNNNGGGGSTTPSTNTQTTQTSQTTTQTTVVIPTIIAKEPVEIKINNPNLEITSIAISTIENVNGGKIEIEKIKQLPLSEEIMIGLCLGGGFGKVYTAFSIILNKINNDILSNATIGFKINKTWYKENNGTFDQLKLFRQNSTTREWDTLSTSFDKEDDSFVYFQARTPGFSTFAVLFAKCSCTPNLRRCFDNNVQLCLGNSTWLVTEKCEENCVQGICTQTSTKIIYTIVIVTLSISIAVTFSLVMMRILKRKRKLI